MTYEKRNLPKGTIAARIAALNRKIAALKTIDA
jgi:hypothetical protein